MAFLVIAPALERPTVLAPCPDSRTWYVQCVHALPLRTDAALQVGLTTTDAVPESFRIRILNVLWDDAHGAGKSGVPIAAGQHRAATRSSFNRFGIPYVGFANAENICYFRT